ncbi:MAG: hypothetical protein ACUVTP_05395, partial [Candidatus Fervidibacter sp.]
APKSVGSESLGEVAVVSLRTPGFSHREAQELEGFYIADVNRSDKYREVVVYTPGPSDDYEHAFFWFDGQRIHKMGHLMRMLKFLGNGIVLAKD